MRYSILMKISANLAQFLDLVWDSLAVLWKPRQMQNNLSIGGSVTSTAKTWIKSKNYFLHLIICTFHTYSILHFETNETLLIERNRSKDVLSLWYLWSIVIWLLGTGPKCLNNCEFCVLRCAGMIDSQYLSQVLGATHMFTEFL